MSTLDLILFKGTSVYPSRLIEILTWSTYSHVGVVVRDPTYIQESLRGEYMLESGEESRCCVAGGEGAWGVQVQHWPWILTSYPGKIFRRQVEWIVKPHDFDKRMRVVWEETRHASYDLNVLDFIRARFNVNLGSTCQITNEFICSSFAAYILCCVGALPDTLEWTKVLPSAFVDGGYIDQQLAKKGVARLGSLTQMK